MKNNKSISHLAYFIGCIFVFFQLFGSVASADYLVYQVSNVQHYDLYEKPQAVYQPAPEQTNHSSNIGKASYYGIQYHGRPTSSGETYDMYAMTAAHPNLPFGTHIRVTNLQSGQSVIVRVNDRGPSKPGRIVDVSQAAAEHLGLLLNGTADVQIDIVG
ncbi:Rare lipoprotein A (RlpA)-like double-psi beta-barrel [Thiothrix caldifontis]|uniref:Endolytic peptidoglycan transglycosylase RlpA n=1 Tax=Thiothrix caldifontis TaxID=525918 RepID=A0A1H4AWE6_9GAMM|nr:septal ring lytic transglycosylase RlpA family protein [Thiothrix caldifontis]SEA40166.1 Rare lipoprotein A (RlpA)-like double-psi beta-barrel [Thiothrix caldifontis]